LPVMAGGAARRRPPWSGYRTRRGRAGYARESFVERSGRVRPPAGCRRGPGRRGRAGALARIEVPRAGLTWDGAAGYLARDNGRALRPGDAFRAASVTKSVTAAVTLRLACQGRLALGEPLAGQLAPNCFTADPPLMLFRAPRRASCSRTPRACPTTSPTRRSPRGCVRSQAAASSTPTPATWSPGSWWSTGPASRCTRFTASSSSTRSGWTRPG
jgi:Beta-lactamase